MFEDLDRTRASILESQKTVSGTLRLVGGMTVCLYVFPALLKAFRRDHPAVDVKLIPGPTPRLIRQLRAGTADLGLLTLPVDDPHLVSVPVMREELLLVTAPTHPLAEAQARHAAGSGRSALRPLRGRLGQPQGDRGVLRPRADCAEGGHRDRERRDHQGAGADRDGDHDHPVSGGGA